MPAIYQETMMNIERFVPFTHRGAAAASVLLLGIATLAGCKPTEPEHQAPITTAVSAAAPATPAGEVPGVLIPAPIEVDRNPLTTCNIETVNEVHFSGKPIPVKADGAFMLGGFLFDAETKSVPDNIRMRLVGPDQQHAWETPVEGRMDRPGLPEYLKIGDWAFRSGFMQQVRTDGLAVGKYHLEVSFIRDGKRFVCDNGRDVLVTP